MNFLARLPLTERSLSCCYADISLATNLTRDLAIATRAKSHRSTSEHQEIPEIAECPDIAVAKIVVVTPSHPSPIREFFCL